MYIRTIQNGLAWTNLGALYLKHGDIEVYTKCRMFDAIKLIQPELLFV